MKKFFGIMLALVIAATSMPIAIYAKTENQPTASAIETPATIIVFRKSNLIEVYNKANQPIKTLPVSTGKPGHETPLGFYQIYQHTDNGGYHPMEDGTFARYCMRFKQGGFMFHSVCYANKGDEKPISEEVSAIGTSVSLGCVRLNVDDAKWLYNATPNGCQVVVIDY